MGKCHRLISDMTRYEWEELEQNFGFILKGKHVIAILTEKQWTDILLCAYDNAET
jgi:hypothetical protein